MSISYVLIRSSRICPQTSIRDGTAKKKSENSSHNRVCTFENMVMSYFQATRPQSKIESYYTTGTQKKASVLMVTATILGRFVGPSLSDDEVKRQTKKREMGDQTNRKRREYIRKKGLFQEKMWECSW